MRSLNVLAPMALGSVLLLSQPSVTSAQTRVVIEHGRSQPAVYRSRPIRRVAIRTLHIERVFNRGDRPHAERWWVRRGFRPVTVYVADGRFYDRWHDRRGLRAVTVYYRDGRYYRDWAMRGDRYDRRAADRWERDNDRWERDNDRWQRDDERHDDRDHGRR